MDFLGLEKGVFNMIKKILLKQLKKV